MHTYILWLHTHTCKCKKPSMGHPLIRHFNYRQETLAAAHGWRASKHSKLQPHTCTNQVLTTTKKRFVGGSGYEKTLFTAATPHGLPELHLTRTHAWKHFWVLPESTLGPKTSIQPYCSQNDCFSVFVIINHNHVDQNQKAVKKKH